jgi:hypothetical protein
MGLGRGHLENSVLTKFLNQQDCKTTFDAHSKQQEEDDLQKFEKLLDKLIKEGRLDKVDLFRKIGMKSGGGSEGGVNALLVANSVHSSQPKHA